MIKIKRPQALMRLRRLALAAQGLLQTQPYGRGLSGARKAINHIGYVQIDTISVVERAHHHVFYTRVPNFDPPMVNKMLLGGDIFEYWTHAAAFIPISDFRFSLPYKQAIKDGQIHWYKKRDNKLMEELIARIRSDGPLKSRDLETDSAKRTGWWDWKPAKKALEQLYMEGDLMVRERDGFEKIYDLTERVLSPCIDTSMPSAEDFAEHIIAQQLRCHGLVSLKGLTYLRRNTELRKAVKTLVAERLGQGSLEQVQLESGEIFLLEAGAFECPLPRLKDRMLILSPFDNSVIQRERVKALFQYDYQLECYVPAAKRKYGYFCLPLLFRDELIGRMDCKVHRKHNHFEIKSLYIENHSFDDDLVVSAFVDAVKDFCCFQQCSSVSLINIEPKHLYPYCNSMLRDLFPS